MTCKTQLIVILSNQLKEPVQFVECSFRRTLKSALLSFIKVTGGADCKVVYKFYESKKYLKIVVDVNGFRHTFLAHKISNFYKLFIKNKKVLDKRN